jgi:hypothetical protein
MQHFSVDWWTGQKRQSRPIVAPFGIDSGAAAIRESTSRLKNAASRPNGNAAFFIAKKRHHGLYLLLHHSGAIRDAFRNSVPFGAAVGGDWPSKLGHSSKKFGLARIRFWKQNRFWSHFFLDFLCHFFQTVFFGIDRISVFLDSFENQSISCNGEPVPQRNCESL